MFSISECNKKAVLLLHNAVNTAIFGNILEQQQNNTNNINNKVIVFSSKSLIKVNINIFADLKQVLLCLLSKQRLYESFTRKHIL